MDQCNVTFLLVECRLFYKQIKVEGKVENVNELRTEKIIRNEKVLVLVGIWE